MRGTTPSSQPDARGTSQVTHRTSGEPCGGPDACDRHAWIARRRRGIARSAAARPRPSTRTASSRRRCGSTARQVTGPTSDDATAAPDATRKPSATPSPKPRGSPRRRRRSSGPAATRAPTYASCRPGCGRSPGSSTGRPGRTTTSTATAVKGFQGKRGLPRTGEDGHRDLAAAAEDDARARQVGAVRVRRAARREAGPALHDGPRAVHQQDEPHAALDDRRHGRCRRWTCGSARSTRRPARVCSASTSSRATTCRRSTTRPCRTRCSSAAARPCTTPRTSRPAATTAPRTAASTSGTRGRSLSLFAQVRNGDKVVVYW